MYNPYIIYMLIQYVWYIRTTVSAEAVFLQTSFAHHNSAHMACDQFYLVARKRQLLTLVLLFQQLSQH